MLNHKKHSILTNSTTTDTECYVIQISASANPQTNKLCVHSEGLTPVGANTYILTVRNLKDINSPNHSLIHIDTDNGAVIRQMNVANMSSLYVVNFERDSANVSVANANLYYFGNSFRPGYENRVLYANINCRFLQSKTNLVFNIDSIGVTLKSKPVRREGVTPANWIYPISGAAIIANYQGHVAEGDAAGFPGTNPLAGPFGPTFAEYSIPGNGFEIWGRYEKQNEPSILLTSTPYVGGNPRANLRSCIDGFDRMNVLGVHYNKNDIRSGSGGPSPNMWITTEANDGSDTNLFIFRMNTSAFQMTGTADTVFPVQNCSITNAFRDIPLGILSYEQQYTSYLDGYNSFTTRMYRYFLKFDNLPGTSNNKKMTIITTAPYTTRIIRANAAHTNNNITIDWQKKIWTRNSAILVEDVYCDGNNIIIGATYNKATLNSNAVFIKIKAETPPLSQNIMLDVTDTNTTLYFSDSNCAVRTGFAGPGFNVHTTDIGTSNVSTSSWGQNTGIFRTNSAFSVNTVTYITK